MLAIFLYNLVIKNYFLGIRIAALFQKKAKKWVDGRRGLFEKLEEDFAFQKRDPQTVIWFHCASLGEFEQGRTVIEALKKERPAFKILLTFFSPSGYEIRKNYPMADWVYYLPSDSKGNAFRFIKIVRPALVVFVKYEFWFHFLSELRNNKIPILLIAAFFRKSQPFFSWYGALHRQMLGCFSNIFVQDENSVELLKSIGLNTMLLAGDPRIDRVLDIASAGKHFPEIAQFCGDSPVLVAGSTWPKDEELLFYLTNQPIFKRWKMILAPHDTSPKRIQELKALFKDRSVVHSNLDTKRSDEDILIIDSIGKLAWLYRYGRVAYIGGGFGESIHNTLEPMAFHLPVIYGPRYTKFVEAITMAKAGGHFPIRTAQQLASELKMLQEFQHFTDAKKAVTCYMELNKGATKTIVDQVLMYF